MLFYGRAQKIAVFAVDTATGIGKTGDVGNFTLKVSKDGAANAAASNTPTEIGYGLYSLELTASECSADLVCVSGVSSTSGVSISPIIATTEAQAIPYAAAGGNGGLPTVDASNHVAGVVATVSADVVSVSGDSTAADNLEADYDGTGYNKSASTIGTKTANPDMRGTDSAFLASSAPTNFGDLAITASTGRVTVGTNSDKTGYSISGTLQTLDALNNFDPAADTVANVTTAGTVTNGVTVSTVSDGAIGADAVADIWSTTALAESYASDGSTGTPAQLLYMIQQATTEFAISGTSLTVKKVDGSTTAGVWTLDDASAPTSRTRAS